LTRPLTTKRWTFIVDATGKVVYRDDAVVAQDDSKKVAEAIKKLKG
jgi:peroxiredoxin